MKPTILTVDDDPAVSQAITRDLRRQYGAEYQIVRAASGAEALAVLREFALRDRPVALIASDQRMPEMTGVEFLERRARTRPTRSSCCSRRTPTPTWRSRRSTTSASTTTCSSRGTRRRSGSTPCSTTCWATGATRTPTTAAACASSGTAGRSAATRSRRSSRATTCRTSWLDLERDEEAMRLHETAQADAERPPARAAPRRRALARAFDARARRRARPAHARRAAALRPLHRRRRPGRARGRGVRRVGGPADRRHRTRGPGRAGRRRAPRSRTTSASRRASPAPTSRTGPSRRCGASAPRWCSRATSSASRSAARSAR